MTYKGEYILSLLNVCFFYMSTSHSLHSSAQSEGGSGRAALYLCFDWPWGMPEVWLLPSHQQHTNLPLHTQVHLCECVWGGYWKSNSHAKFNHAFKIIMKTLFHQFDCSYLPWFEVFYKLLNNLADYLTKGQVSFHCLCVIFLYLSISLLSTHSWVINITSTIMFSTDQWDEGAAGCALQAALTTGSRICHSADGKCLIIQWEPGVTLDFMAVFCQWLACCVFFWGRAAIGQHRSVPSCWTPREKRGGESRRGSCGLE